MIEPPIEEIVRKIAEAFRPRRIVMFGSRARGDTRPDSDLDLTVEMETDDPPAQRATGEPRAHRVCVANSTT